MNRTPTLRLIPLITITSALLASAQTPPDQTPIPPLEGSHFNADYATKLANCIVIASIDEITPSPKLDPSHTLATAAITTIKAIRGTDFIKRAQIPLIASGYYNEVLPEKGRSYIFYYGLTPGGLLILHKLLPASPENIAEATRLAASIPPYPAPSVKQDPLPPFPSIELLTKSCDLIASATVTAKSPPSSPPDSRWIDISIDKPVIGFSEIKTARIPLPADSPVGIAAANTTVGDARLFFLKVRPAGLLELIALSPSTPENIAAITAARDKAEKERLENLRYPGSALTLKDAATAADRIVIVTVNSADEVGFVSGGRSQGYGEFSTTQTIKGLPNPQHIALPIELVAAEFTEFLPEKDIPWILFLKSDSGLLKLLPATPKNLTAATALLSTPTATSPNVPRP